LVRCVLVLLLLAGMGAAPAADQAALGRTVKSLVEDIHLATVQGRYARVIELTHPKAVEALGGPSLAMETMAKQLYDLRRSGVAIRGAVVGTPSAAVTAGDEMYIVVPYTLELESDQGHLIETPSFMIGLSGDRGETWTFVNGNQDLAKVKEILPALPEALPLPARQAPKITELADRLKPLLADLKKDPDPQTGITPAAERLVRFGLPAIDHGLLDTMLSPDAETRQRAQQVLEMILREHMGYSPVTGWPGGVDRSEDLRLLWVSNGDYAWNKTAEQRAHACERWKEWLARVRQEEAEARRQPGG
jgi:hypothetical protein